MLDDLVVWLHTWTLFLPLSTMCTFVNYVQYIPTWWLHTPAQSLKFAVMSVDSNLTIYI